jgi:predicted O-linked N-acetylglucosamine transferase (SPINDLY family)
MMGLDELVAATIEDYVFKAVRLAQDRTYREEVAGRIALGKACVYRDRTTIIALEDFLERVTQRENGA